MLSGSKGRRTSGRYRWRFGRLGRQNRWTWTSDWYLSSTWRFTLSSRHKRGFFSVYTVAQLYQLQHHESLLYGSIPLSLLSYGAVLTYPQSPKGYPSGVTAFYWLAPFLGCPLGAKMFQGSNSYTISERCSDEKIFGVRAWVMCISD